MDGTQIAQIALIFLFVLTAAFPKAPQPSHKSKQKNLRNHENLRPISLNRTQITQIALIFSLPPPQAVSHQPLQPPTKANKKICAIMKICVPSIPT